MTAFLTMSTRERRKNSPVCGFIWGNGSLLEPKVIVKASRVESQWGNYGVDWQPHDNIQNQMSDRLQLATLYPPPPTFLRQCFQQCIQRKHMLRDEFRLHPSTLNNTRDGHFHNVVCRSKPYSEPDAEVPEENACWHYSRKRKRPSISIHSFNASQSLLGSLGVGVGVTLTRGHR